MKFVIVWNSTLDVCSGFYESDAPDYGRFGGPIGSVTATTSTLINVNIGAAYVSGTISGHWVANAEL